MEYVDYTVIPLSIRTIANLHSAECVLTKVKVDAVLVSEFIRIHKSNNIYIYIYMYIYIHLC